MKHNVLQLLVLSALASSAAMGQINCAPGSSAFTKLVCEFPFATGALTNDSALGQNGQASAITAASTEASIIDSALAAQLGQLPLATASAGTVVAYKNGVPETFNNLGPILVDRAQTIGRKKVFVGFSASQFVFTDVDGLSLKNLPFAYSRTAYNGTTPVSTTYTNETAKASFVANQFVAVATYGLASKADLSVIVPVLRVSLGTYVPPSTENIVSANGSPTVTQTGPSQSAQGLASGVGDIELAVKYEAYTSEHAAVAAGAIIRIPTGDAENLLGSGAWGGSPYLVYSYLARFSPHLKIAYQWNSATELNNPTYINPVTDSSGNIVKQSDQALPGGIQYDIGADWAVGKRFTVAADALGYQFVNGQRVVVTNKSFTGLSSPLQTTITQNSTYAINDISTGFKWNPGGNVVVSANLLTQVNNDGLRSRPTPLLGIACKF